MDWDEYMPFEEWRGGRGSPGGGTIEPNPVVSCRACGHEEPEGSISERCRRLRKGSCNTMPRPATHSGR